MVVGGAGTDAGGAVRGVGCGGRAEAHRRCIASRLSFMGNVVLWVMQRNGAIESSTK